MHVYNNFIKLGENHLSVYIGKVLKAVAAEDGMQASRLHLQLAKRVAVAGATICCFIN